MKSIKNPEKEINKRETIRVMCIQYGKNQQGGKNISGNEKGT